jgi:hypothetical protein
VKPLAVVVLLSSASAAAGPLALGAFVGVPGEGSGPPIAGRHVPVGLTGRYALMWAPAGLETAITVGLGLPIATVGASMWSGLELRLPFAEQLAVYAVPGLRTGFVGPGYYARHSGVFAGFGYIYSGPWTIAPRLPVGVAVTLGRTVVYVEVLAEAPLLPGPELLFGGALGVRVTL